MQNIILHTKMYLFSFKNARGFSCGTELPLSRRTSRKNSIITIFFFLFYKNITSFFSDQLNIVYKE